METRRDQFIFSYKLKQGLDVAMHKPNETLTKLILDGINQVGVDACSIEDENASEYEVLGNILQQFVNLCEQEKLYDFKSDNVIQRIVTTTALDQSMQQAEQCGWHDLSLIIAQLITLLATRRVNPPVFKSLNDHLNTLIGENKAKGFFSFSDQMKIRKIEFLNDFLKESLGGDRFTDILLRLNGKHQIRALMSDQKDPKMAHIFNDHYVDVSCLPRLDSAPELK